MRSLGAMSVRVLFPSALILLAMLAACGERRPWTAYALRDNPGPDDLRVLGTFANPADCRQGALAADSDPDHENLVCTRDCPPPQGGILTDCAETRVVRVPEAVLPSEERRTEPR